jgi:hypothetical protein
MLRLFALLGCLLATGCAALPERISQPTLHNPFPQISRVGVVPFFNLSSEATLNGRKVAEAYAAELAEVPGFDVISVSVVETAMHGYQIDFSKESDVSQLAQKLDVDALVVGTITEYWPYYPPRLTLKVAWYTANPNFHPIPAGYGLPWGTSAEKDIPGPLAFQAEFALAKEQLKTQTPPMPKSPPPDPVPGPARTAPSNAVQSGAQVVPTSAESPSDDGAKDGTTGSWSSKNSAARRKRGAQNASYQEQSSQPANPPASPAIAAGAHREGQFPPDWPDAHGFIPRPPSAHPVAGIPCDDPVMQHTKSYRGNDVAFTTALEDYYTTRDDARLGGWDGYLRRSDDFVRFCCRMHIWEMLGARGGAGETRVVWRWSTVR